MIILGIDPGLADTGYGVLIKDRELKYLTHGSIKTKAGLAMADRLRIIYRELKSIIKKYSPEVIAVEKLFFCKNVKTALAVGQARGVILLTASQATLQLEEYTPLQVKQAVVGYGNADKQQVQAMVKTILNLKKIPEPDDAADALAIAICCAHSIRK
ncbi:MAG: crossover junction endodeoxyribonuclease RuvC [bacterium]